MTKDNTNKEREKIRKMAISTLETQVFQQVLGSNQTQSNPYLFGRLGINGAEKTYQESLASEDAQKIRSELAQEGKKMGVYGLPTDREVSIQIMRQIEDMKRLVSLEDLLKQIKGINSEIKIQVPDALKDYIPMELIQKAQKAGGADKLNEKEQHALEMYQTLSGAYDRACGLKSIKGNYFAEFEKTSDAINEKYAPKEKKE